MKTVNDAIGLLKKNCTLQKVETIDLLHACGCYSAEDVFANMDVPSFDNSSVDGYCFRYEDFENNIPLKITHTIFAGQTKIPKIKAGETFRIFTGAMVPKNADTVVMQEHTSAVDGYLHIHNKLEKGNNVRKQGTQTKKKSAIVFKNEKITASFISFLATFGIHKLTVYKKPTIGIIVTGTEIIQPPQKLKKGQIYESNSVSLKASLQCLKYDQILTLSVGDDLNEISKAIKTTLKKIDILILTGGISVGDFDFVHRALVKNKVKEVFYKVKQKPGKPFYFGTLKNKKIFSLPGNPASVLTCFHIYVKPFIQMSMGSLDAFSNYKKALLKHDYLKNGNSLTHFVKAYFEDGHIEILENQQSYQMDAFKRANCIAILKEDQEYFIVGEKIEFISI